MADEVEDDGSPASSPKTRRPYFPPRIEWEEPLEDRPHLVAACAQRPGQDFDCNASPTS